jgi:DNA invertase Pin-like site-specific DNA recombinase
LVFRSSRCIAGCAIETRPEAKGGCEMKVALYARISTTNHGQDVNLQLRELREYCQRRNLEITREYADSASGAKDSRPELNRLMVDAKHRRFDAVCVWKLDRFGRSVRHLVNALADLESLGVSFISLKDNLDLSTPSGRLMFQIIGAMAEFERALIQERVRAGLRNARAKGKRLGRPRVIVDLATIARLRAQGLSWAKIAAQLEVGEGTVYRLAHAPAKNPIGSAPVSPYAQAAD